MKIQSNVTSSTNLIQWRCKYYQVFFGRFAVIYRCLFPQIKYFCNYSALFNSQCSYFLISSQPFISKAAQNETNQPRCHSDPPTGGKESNSNYLSSRQQIPHPKNGIRNDNYALFFSFLKHPAFVGQGVKGLSYLYNNAWLNSYFFFM